MNLELEGIGKKQKSRMQEFRGAQRRANKALAELTRHPRKLGEALDNVKRILECEFGVEVAKITEGIYCGEAGRCADEIPGYPGMLIMDWYSGRLEVAYIS